MTITAPHPDLAVGPDGVVRCGWPGIGHADYRDYHDREWGKPVHGETALLERLCLEGFQSGLSWLTILRKRPAFRDAFAGFDAHYALILISIRGRPSSTSTLTLACWALRPRIVSHSENAPQEKYVPRSYPDLVEPERVYQSPL